MKKAKNIVLLIGMIFNSLYILLQFFKFVYHCITVLPQSTLPIKYFIISDLLPILILIALMVLPVVLLILNLKNKTGKVLPIVSAVICGPISFLSSVPPAIPQYLIYSKLHLIDTYWVYWIGFITDGGISCLIGFSLLAVGSIMSLIKSKE